MRADLQAKADAVRKRYRVGEPLAQGVSFTPGRLELHRLAADEIAYKVVLPEVRKALQGAKDSGLLQQVSLAVKEIGGNPRCATQSSSS